MQHLLIDACGWAAVIDSGMNFDIELGKVLGKPEILLLPKVLEELEALDTQRPRAKKLLLGMLKGKTTEIEANDDSGGHTDDQILDLAYVLRSREGVHDLLRTHWRWRFAFHHFCVAQIGAICCSSVRPSGEKSKH